MIFCSGQCFYFYSILFSNCVCYVWVGVRHSEESTIPKAVIQGLLGIVLDVVFCYLAIGGFKGKARGPWPQNAKSRPLLSLCCIEMIAYLSLFIATYSIVSIGFWCVLL